MNERRYREAETACWLAHGLEPGDNRVAPSVDELEAERTTISRAGPLPRSDLPARLAQDTAGFLTRGLHERAATAIRAG